MSAARAFWLSAMVACTVAACATSGGRQRCPAPRAPGELAQLARISDSAANAIRLSVDTMADLPRRFLRGVVDRVTTIESCGGVRTPEQLRDAARAALAARTLGLATVQQAYLWSRSAVVADSADRENWRVMAEAWDQMQVLEGKPQWFATVVTCVSPILGRCSVAPLDTTRVTEALRFEFGLRTLQQQRRLVDSLNRVRGQP